MGGITPPRNRHGGPTLRRWRWAALSVVLAAAGLSSGCTTASQVRWATYDPALQQQIDSAAAQKDCLTLNALHTKAHVTNKAHTKATGYSNAALINYIETAQRAADCTP
jgi:hypothetical protein